LQRKDYTIDNKLTYIEHNVEMTIYSNIF